MKLRIEIPDRDTEEHNRGLAAEVAQLLRVALHDHSIKVVYKKEEIGPRHWESVD